ncbi:SDR family NAD(P)-dependent oxidoreductase [Streptomyces albipurpureus]|uniref:SDR family oxidoreductase n=1 Tax=Streptomyces albipurpureus TaxID=2897419 RepID=A0ABT0UG11_9ACTN|nr:SDR family NAD(P)-dependent oxidoreductase [Streptomyces sp. CWNU-1]MCM2387562.1 SDR family oxidoreductase [Streptomyces sp. CWNU-1]
MPTSPSNAPREFDGRTAFVTGGASGIGLAVCALLAARGAAVAVADVDAVAAKNVAGQLTANGGTAIGLAVDVADPESVREAVEATVERLGGLHLAVNNAGISGAVAPLADYPLADWRRVMAVNLDGVFHSLRCELPVMSAAGGGAVVNVASVMGTVATSGGSAYVAAKHGVIGLTKTAALEYASQGIRVNAVGPGFIETPLLQRVNAEGRAALAALHPEGRMGTSEEVAEIICFLLSDRASFVQGSYHLVDGGYTAR